MIEDDPRIQRVLYRQFTAEGYEVHIEGEGPAGLAAVKRMKPATVVLDLMLPGLSGRAICKEIKQWSRDTPVIVLSAISEVADKVLSGADDCDIHPDMGAVVVSLSTPYYAVSKADGRIVLRDVPRGRYRVHLWAENVGLQSLNGLSRDVQIDAQDNQLGTFELKTSAEMVAHHKNKFGEDYSPTPKEAY